MAVTMVRTDDLNGDESAEQITFGLHDKTYVIDLAAKSLAGLEAALAPFIDAALIYGDMPELVERKPAAPAKKPPTGNAKFRNRKAGQGPYSRIQQQRRVKIREWATSNGYTVSSNGKIPDAVVEAYEEIHGPADA